MLILKVLKAVRVGPVITENNRTSNMMATDEVWPLTSQLEEEEEDLREQMQEKTC